MHILFLIFLFYPAPATFPKFPPNKCVELAEHEEQPVNQTLRVSLCLCVFSGNLHFSEVLFWYS